MVARNYELSRFHFFFFLHTDLQLHNIPITSGTNTETSVEFGGPLKYIERFLATILCEVGSQFSHSYWWFFQARWIHLKPSWVNPIWNIFWFIKRAVLSLNHRVQNLISCGCALNFSTKKKELWKGAKYLSSVNSISNTNMSRC